MSDDELVDIVDEQDRVLRQATGRAVRAETLRHRSVYVLVFTVTGQLFVHQRAMAKDIYPGYWDVAVGGMLRAGESYEDGARRELEEELGVTQVPLRRLFSIRYEDAANRVCGVVYSCTADRIVRLQASEIVRGEWMDIVTVLERTQRDAFCPDGLEALRLYLAKLDAARVRR